MKKTTRNFLLHIVVFVLVLYHADPVFAHGDEPRLEISAELVNPGGVVDVRGVDFEREEVVTLMLVNDKTAIPLGEIVADVEGVFLQTLALPVDLAEGTYNFLAITDDHKIFSPELTVQGPPSLDSEAGHDEGVREEEEPLLAPMPTFAPGVVPGGVLPPTIQLATTTTESVSSQSAMAMILSAFLIAGVLVLIGLRVMRKK